MNASRSLPSLGAAVTAALDTLRRFPLVLAAAVLAALAAILLQNDMGPDAFRGPLLAAATLGLPLLTAVSLFAAQRDRPIAARAGVVAAAVLVLIGVHVGWPLWSDPTRFARYAQLSVAFHLLVALLPFAGRPDGSFWEYNRALFVRILAAAASSATLFAGLALALAAIHALFGLDVPADGYFRLFLVIAFVFNTWFFLAGVPAEPVRLASQPYPQALRVFAQYTLVTLVSVYLVILTAYLGKVVVTRDWPSGWIGWLVSGVAAAGILALLLVHPLTDDPGQRWIATFARDFWRAILPSVGMLWLALYQRIHQYGITEPRYFLLVLSVWLAAVALLHVITRSRGIRHIPASLCALAVLSFAGPWGAYAVARRSQAGRLRTLLAARAMPDSGRTATSRAAAPPDVEGEIRATVRYLVTTHGAASLAPVLADSLGPRLRFAAGRAGGGEFRVQMVLGALRVPYRSPWERATNGQPFQLTADELTVVPVAGYEAMIRILAEPDAPATGVTLTAALVADSTVLRVRRGTQVLVEFPLDSLIARAGAAGRRTPFATLPAADLRMVREGGGVRAMLQVRDLSGTINGRRAMLRGVAGDVFLHGLP